MDPKVCVNCSNKNAVNGTDNRLVTESCGHVKCMQCLLQETTGCVACKKSKSLEEKKDVLEKEPECKKAKVERNDLVSDPEASLEPEVCITEAVQTDPQTEQECGMQHRKYKLNTAHIVTVTDGKNDWYLCTVCNRKFTARSQVTYHAYCDGQKKPYECRDCKKSFATHSHYNYHMQSEHGTSRRGRYVCDLCDASFIQKSKLQRHKLAKHTKEKKYICKECNKAFNNACSLRKHGLLHSGEQPFLCPDCPRRFRDSSNLKKHIENIHASQVGTTPSRSKSRSKSRKHKCASCARAFHTRKDLRRHEGIHTEQKPFECPVCLRSPSNRAVPRFRRRDNFVRHLRNTHAIHTPRTNGQNGTTPKGSHELREKATLEKLNPLPPLPEEVIQKHLYTDDKTEQAIDKKINGEIIDKETHSETIDKKTHSATTDKQINSETIDKKTSETIDNKTNSLATDKADNKKEASDLTQISPHEECIDKESTDSKSKDAVIDKSYIIEANNARASVIVGKVQERKVPSPVPAYVHKIRKANSLSCQKEVCLPPIDKRKLVELVTLYPHKEEKSRGALDVPPLRVKDVQTLKNILHDKADKHEHTPTVHWRKKRLTDNE